MRTAIATIDLSAVRENLARVRALAPQSKVLAVIKADGYGHGLERMVEALPDADGYGVASVEDAERVRAFERSQQRPGKRVVLLSGCNDEHDVRASDSLGLTVVLHQPEQLELIRATPCSRPLDAWIKVDTGMHRLGFALKDVARLREQLDTLALSKSHRVWMTHFANADGCRQSTQEQIARFNRALGPAEPVRSMANSAGILGFPEAHAQWVRPGGLLYGLSTIPGMSGSDLGFRPVMRVSSRLIAIKDVTAGAWIGYGESYRAEHDMRIGVVSFGYGDGYPRHASNRGKVWIGGHRCRILGRVSMDLMTVELKPELAAAIGDEVVLWGPELAAEAVAEDAETISYELTCGVTRRVRFECQARVASARAEPHPGSGRGSQNQPPVAIAANHGLPIEA